MTEDQGKFSPSRDSAMPVVEPKTFHRDAYPFIQTVVERVGRRFGIERGITARQILEELETQDGPVRTSPAIKEPDDQISMMDLSHQQIADALRAIQVETLTPIEAMNELYKLKRMLD